MGCLPLKCLIRHPEYLTKRSSFYCLSYTETLVYLLPVESVPWVVTVRLLPSGAITTCAVKTTFPPFFDTTLYVCSLSILAERMSSFGFPVDG